MEMFLSVDTGGRVKSDRRKIEEDIT